MIKTNLLVTDSKSSSSAFVSGIDFSVINWKMILLSLLIFFGADILKTSYFDSKLKVVQSEIDQVNSQKQKLKKQLDSLKDIKLQVEEVKKLEATLTQKVEILKKILEYKRIPLKIFTLISASIPENTWFDSLVIKENMIQIKGRSRDYKNIGLFIDTIKSSTFFEQGLKLDSNKTEEDGKFRNEVFSLSGQVSKWE
jgi:Tfp pilus assembly protein PilN